MSDPRRWLACHPHGLSSRAMSDPIICFLSVALGVLAMFILIAFSPEIGDFLSRFRR